MSDLDKLLAGEQIYRNEDKRHIADHWQGWADFFQFGTMGLLFMFMFILKALPRETAKVVVWYGAVLLFITATIGFFLGRKAIKHQMQYLNAESKRVTDIANDAIERVKS